jgi:hypothetical protein
MEEPLPVLPIWLTEETSILLNLESTYESACHSLRIGR